MLDKNKKSSTAKPSVVMHGMKIKIDGTNQIVEIDKFEQSSGGGNINVYCKPFGKFVYNPINNTLPRHPYMDTYPKVWFFNRGWGTIQNA